MSWYPPPQAAVGMFGYITDLSLVEERTTETVAVSGEYWCFCSWNQFTLYPGHDLESLLYNFLDEWLFLFSAEPYFVPKVVQPVAV